ncbi:transposase [Actinokineospora sp.]|uniref:transposase n=1 Tax=Actinokineospora sp. TaxID=1872133 RepID=UPI003D6A6634
MVEVTMRTVHGRLLLRPSRAVNDLIVGVIGRAQRRYGMRLHALAVLGNHWHSLMSPDSPQQLAAFVDYVAGNIAREVGRLHEWREKFWARRYRSIVVSHEEEAQAGRLEYILGQGVREGLVERPHQWPGVHCAVALESGTDLEGT